MEMELIVGIISHLIGNGLNDTQAIQQLVNFLTMTMNTTTIRSLQFTTMNLTR